MRNIHKVMPMLLVIVVLSVLACAPHTTSAAPELPGGPVRVSEEAAKRLEDKINQTFAQNASGQFTLNITDEELTSYIALRVTNQSDASFADPQIRFTQGKVFGAVTMKQLLLPLRVVLVAVVSLANDRVQFQIQKSSAGPFPVPGFALDALSKTINDTLLEAQLDVQVTSIEILESEVVVAGHLRS